MPVYEFSCNSCGASVSVFVRTVSSPVNAACERCGSADLRRLVSKFAVLRGAGRGDLDSLDGMEGLDDTDPRAMAAWARQLQRESGEDMGPEFDAMVDKLERGESIDDELGLDGHTDDDDDFL